MHEGHRRRVMTSAYEVQWGFIDTARTGPVPHANTYAAHIEVATTSDQPGSKSSCQRRPEGGYSGPYHLGDLVSNVYDALDRAGLHPCRNSLWAQLPLATDSKLISAWLRITKVSSRLQTAGEAWQRGCRGKFCHACHGYACMVLRLLAWLHRSFNLTPNSRTALAGSG
ncbi:hypothetical protein BU25DRAFT_37506 [Macroventuria anomochaeta]|uniref:Uncharacterized protein n=1 Tax=Macroventuria anomochaeta TaxID=301207 RepID=A0ACB6S3I8_9PLEO|nr:uncharacterized protein BU25DRAFT_37506 [Macroventuria anomochaeta]KAF2628513.1 hypothetical protein BU25DRAFT_37506 [Macroventuria anomochaeta]